MFAVTWRFVAGLAIGGAAVLLWSSRRTAEAPRLDDRPQPAADSPITITDPRRPERPAPQHFSEYRKDIDGRLEDNAQIDSAVEDTFPASDPPAFMQSVIARPPQHERLRADSEDEIAEAHPS
jgi:hypothetical protein